MRSLEQELQGNPSAAGLSMRLNSFYEGGQGAGEPEPVLGGKGPSAGFQKSAAPDPGRVYLKKGMDYKGLASKLQFVDLKTDLKSMPADQREVIGALLEILPL
ncbi:MAG: hypothetical protein HY611_01400, partial [Elusimicrobia bacterium]|nr:hypothetical protein [Elusimicrobiota bacterium]